MKIAINITESKVRLLARLLKKYEIPRPFLRQHLRRLAESTDFGNDACLMPYDYVYPNRAAARRASKKWLAATEPHVLMRFREKGRIVRAEWHFMPAPAKSV